MSTNFSIIMYTFCISQILINWLKTLFAAMVSTIYETIIVPISNGISGEVKINETM